jgi:hypothetical protein
MPHRKKREKYPQETKKLIYNIYVNNPNMSFAKLAKHTGIPLETIRSMLGRSTTRKMPELMRAKAKENRRKEKEKIAQEICKEYEAAQQIIEKGRKKKRNLGAKFGISYGYAMYIRKNYVATNTKT